MASEPEFYGSLAMSYVQAFRGGSPPHPMHPESKAFHELAVQHEADHELFSVGHVKENDEKVVCFRGGKFWYRPSDFVELCRGSTDQQYRDLVADYDHQKEAES
jgi:hypothetical protein